MLLMLSYGHALWGEHIMEPNERQHFWKKGRNVHFFLTMNCSFKWTSAHDSFRVFRFWLTGMNPVWSSAVEDHPSHGVLCKLRCFSAHHGCKKWLYEWLYNFWPLSSGTNNKEITLSLNSGGSSYIHCTICKDWLWNLTSFFSFIVKHAGQHSIHHARIMRLEDRWYYNNCTSEEKRTHAEPPNFQEHETKQQFLTVYFLLSMY